MAVLPVAPCSISQLYCRNSTIWHLLFISCFFSSRTKLCSISSDVSSRFADYARANDKLLVSRSLSGIARICSCDTVTALGRSYCNLRLLFPQLNFCQSNAYSMSSTRSRLMALWNTLSGGCTLRSLMCL